MVFLAVKTLEQKNYYAKKNGIDGKKENNTEQNVRKLFIPKAQFYSFTIYQMNKYPPVCSIYWSWHNDSFST